MECFSIPCKTLKRLEENEELSREFIVSVIRVEFPLACWFLVIQFTHLQFRSPEKPRSTAKVVVHVLLQSVY